jgi:hypothetical protein
MKSSENLSHHSGRLAVTRRWLKVKVLQHRIEDATLNRLQTVTDIGKGSTRNYAQGVGQVSIS